MPATPHTLTEQAQNFAFGATTWQEVERYDNCDAHLALTASVQRTQCVDFVALARGNSKPQLLLVEVKDYRASAKGMPKHSELAKELAEKVAGTLAGIQVAARSSQAGFNWKRAGTATADPQKKLMIVLHVESAAWATPLDCKLELTALIAALEKELRWLKECTISACSERSPFIPDCVVI